MTFHHRNVSDEANTSAPAAPREKSIKRPVSANVALAMASHNPPPSRSRAKTGPPPSGPFEIDHHSTSPATEPKKPAPPGAGQQHGIRRNGKEQSFGEASKDILQNNENKAKHIPKRDDDIDCMRLPSCIWTSELMEMLLKTANLPPVTRETVQELDLQWIQNNVSLRIDVHYDHDLHFMPVSGSRGAEKLSDAQKYWKCLGLELYIYQHDSIGQCAMCQSQQSTTTFTPRLATMFDELKKLLFILVPERERGEVEGTLDVPLLMQQVRHNALDIVRLSHWLSGLLTTHCAPIRDEWAEDMASKISQGARNNDMASLVGGLEKLFTFCEAMKLDVANHQIRTFRVPLIEDGVPFQQDYFSTRVRNGKLDIAASRDWFLSVKSKHFEKEEVNGATGNDALAAGLIELCTFPGLAIPKTLKHDTTRIRQMQEEIQDNLHLGICTKLFDDWIHRRFGPAFNPSAIHQQIMTRIMDLTDGDSEGGEAVDDLWSVNIEPIAIEITRAVYAVARKTGNEVPEYACQIISRQLAEHFEREKSSHKEASSLQEDLLSRTRRHLSDFRKLSALRISETQKQYQQNQQSSISTRLLPDREDISRRLAHIAVIHWRVWGDLAYSDTIPSIVTGVDQDSSLDTGSDAEWELQERCEQSSDTLCEQDVASDKS